MSRYVRAALPLLIAVVLVALAPAKAWAQGAEGGHAEITIWTGGLIGDNFSRGGSNGVERGFRDGIAFGGFFDYFFRGGPIGVEGAGTLSEGADLRIGGNSLDTRTGYVDLSLIVQGKFGRNGTFRPYGLIGLGLQRTTFNTVQEPNVFENSYVFGGGFKLATYNFSRGRWGVRFDIRAHITDINGDGISAPARESLMFLAGDSETVINVIPSIGLFWSF
ncbi:MAG: outer membrane beta-barrel protein [Acidobacteriota bacterium]